MKKIVLQGLVVMLLMCSATLFSHQPNQLTYTFRFNEELSTLTIHFTPKTVLDILEFLQPELKNASQINLNAHESELLNYFEERILLNGKTLKGRMELGAKDLVSHDAFFTFILDDSLGISDDLEIEVNSLADVYSKLENFVFVKHEGETMRYLLSGEQRLVRWKPQEVTTKKQHAGINPLRMVVLVALMFICVSLMLWRKKKVNKKVRTTKIAGSTVKCDI